jgi:hypothetical protein
LQTQRLTFALPVADAGWAERAREHGEPLHVLLPARATGRGIVLDTSTDVDRCLVNVTMDITT